MGLLAGTAADSAHLGCLPVMPALTVRCLYFFNSFNVIPSWKWEGKGDRRGGEGEMGKFQSIYRYIFVLRIFVLENFLL